MNKNDLISMAKTMKKYFIEHKEYPKSIKIKGIDYTIQQATYMLNSFIANPNQTEIKPKSVAGANDPHGDRCNREVIKVNYQDMAKRVNQFILQNGKLPNYVTILNQQKCSIILWMFQCSKIVSAYNNALPSKILINSKDLEKPQPKTYKKYGRSTETGCDNRGQNNGYYCGPHMVQEIIRNLTGKVIPQSKLAGIIGTTTAGSSHQGINTAFAWFNKTYDENLEVEWKNFSDLGWSGVQKILQSNNQDCGAHEAYRRTTDFEGYGHYTNFDKIYNDTIDVHNSLGSTCNYGCYCGYTENRTKSEAKYYLDGISQKSILIVTNK